MIESAESFLQSVDPNRVKKALLKAIIDGIETGTTTPEDTKALHYLHAFVDDITKMQK